MNGIDDAIGRLASAPVDPRLAMQEADWLTEMMAGGRPRHERSYLGSGAFAAALALIVGIVGAGLPGAPADARVALSPLGPATTLAPSTLLADE